MRCRLTYWPCLSLTLLGLTAPTLADPYADSVVDFDLGTGGSSGFTDPTAVLGEPTRFTAPTSPFGGAVTPFNPPFGADEILSLGEGGFITVAFDDPINDDAANPFGIDLLVFGNALFTLQSGGVAGVVANEGGIIEVSANGTEFFTINGVDADGLFPTNGYNDSTEAFPSEAGDEPSDFTKPVDPSFNASGKTLAEILAGYDGSGGGAGVDISSTGLSSISYVRISNPVGAGVNPEIDAFADVVPEPTTLVLLTAGFVAVTARRRGQTF